jgi:D-aspartate ligase
VTRARAVVVGLDCITGLQTARILARQGVKVVGIASDAKHFCCRTRACEQLVTVNGTNDLADVLMDLGPRLGEKAVLFPCTDAYVLAISRNREALSEWFHVVLPEHDVAAMLMNKDTFARHASAAGLPVPRTHVLSSRDDAEEASESLSFPCTLKPAQKTEVWQRHAPAKAFKARDARELLALFDRCCAWSDELIVQEWVVGGEENLYSCNCYFDRNSRPLVTFVARKLRQWPVETGTSSLGEECRNEIVRDTTLRLFEGVGFRGLGYLEMKRDERTGEHYIIEPNIGRPTGRSAIAEAGGVDLMYTAYCDAVDLPLPGNLEQRYTGAKWIYWRADAQASFVRWRRGELTPQGWRRSIRGKRTDAVLSWSDPVPFLLDVFGAMGKATTVALSRLPKTSPREQKQVSDRELRTRA